MYMSRIMLSTYETSCQMKNAEKSMKKSNVNPENLETHLLTTTSDSLVTFSGRMRE